MQRRIIINPQPFIFRQVTNQVRECVKDDGSFIQNGFYINRVNGPQINLRLTNDFIIVQQMLNKSAQLIFYTELDFSLKFEIIYELDGKVQDNLAILSNQIGFRLISEGHEKVQFYSKQQSTVHIWVLNLNKKLNQYGFHKMYKPIKKLGKGGFATVYEIERLTDKKHFAAKAFTKQSTLNSPDINCRNNLLNQIQLLRTFDSKHTIKCQAIFESQNSIYIVLELLEDGQLHARINKRHAQFTELEIQEFIYGMALGLQEMHRYRVMHRDIKPQNIMMRGAQGLRPVIADFGLSAHVDSEDYIFYRCGTPGFVAPEIISLEKGHHIEPQCDIFSLGAIFHILLVKKPLFDGKKCEQVYENNRNMRFNLKKPIYETVDEQAFDLLKRMMHINPQQRIKAAEILEHPFLFTFMEREKKIISPSSTIQNEEMNFQTLNLDQTFE